MGDKCDKSWWVQINRNSLDSFEFNQQNSLDMLMVMIDHLAMQPILTALELSTFQKKLNNLREAKVS